MVSWDREGILFFKFQTVQILPKFSRFSNNFNCRYLHISHNFKNDIDFPRFFDSPALHRAQFTAVTIIAGTIHRGTIHREKIKIPLDEFLILLDYC
jgi:hypothetical protein